MEKWKKRILLNALGKKKGDKKMVQIDDLDIERLDNLCKNFGWCITYKDTTPDKIKVMMEKERENPETDFTELDFERLENLCAGFGWCIKDRGGLKDKLTVVLEKNREEPETDISSEPT
ncbi:hypothetical protein LCGC14_2416280 [marine sediment metagenome]|uniref:Uncharacterized protein n=1 Tax=marine sediment metagenome TaxID=412755 RepID=A0A0F9BR22_9ZZZZ